MNKIVFSLLIAVFAETRIGLGQSSVEAKKLLEKSAREVDSTMHSFIADNRWELVYRGEKKGFKTLVSPFERKKILSFDGGNYSFVYADSTQLGHSGEYSFFDMYLILMIGKEEGYYYNILNIIDDRYLIVKVCHITGKRNEKLVTTNKRLLFRKIEGRL